MDFTVCGTALKIGADTVIAFVALLVSLIALVSSVYFWRRQFRPIVTAAVRTAHAGDDGIAYKLELLNSGTIPAKNVILTVDETTLPGAFGADATLENKARWLACFAPHLLIKVLHNGARVTCSFGTTKANGQGFWKVRAQIQLTIQYEGWFGKKDRQLQIVEVVDSASFTGYMWGDGDA